MFDSIYNKSSAKSNEREAREAKGLKTGMPKIIEKHGSVTT